ncbi:transposase, IS4 family [Geoalkalibacter ferrihydriticus]|uniref:Transposase n=2 Tax=Geoalkalibacter ferrihydriticus TaxID=392333 RepID=A0A0C2HPB3_9BACT|nr:IS1182 family transposase [Geoalkalibacter ferrihydriticus]KIH76740.1 transposase [Geoalkalibacter ferrihydriticus DSM 17813]SDL54256.1 transposase, IS4 family [Geoalkalibacter ferrihydriticus]
MPRFIDYDYQQTVMVPVVFDQQILPGTFEYSLNYLIDKKLDLIIFHHRFKNDDGGRPAYDPAILLKIVLLGYSRGFTSSRKIESLCRENVVFMAISADSRPHFTTIADFISRCHDEIAKLFQQVLLICDELGLIGKEMFAVDGCKMPSNASKEWSGTKTELKKKSRKIDGAVRYLLKKHRDEDKKGQAEESIRQRERKQIETLLAASEKIETFLAQNEEKTGRGGNVVKSNITDNDSAKMKSGHGVIQGYNGVAAVDGKHQIVVAAEAFGSGQEHGLLEPMLEQIAQNLEAGEDLLKQAKVLADSGYHNQKTLEHLEEKGIDGYLADHGFRSRDPRFATASRHKDKEPPSRSRKGRHAVAAFSIDTEQQSCICPAGKSMWLKCARAKIGNHIFMQFMGRQADCDSCEQRSKCLRSASQKGARQVNVLLETLPKSQRKNGPIERMREKIDSGLGRHIYSQRLGIVEPVFGNIRETIGIKRFTLRGKKKVDGQWKLMTMLHNIFKIHRYGWAA